MSGLYLEAELAPPEREVDPELRDALLAAARTVALTVEEDGLHFLFGVLFTAAAPKEKKPKALKAPKEKGKKKETGLGVAASKEGDFAA